MPSFPVLLLALLIPFGVQASEPITDYGYRVIKAYPQSPTVFTQGLEFKNGLLYEGAGKFGESQLLIRKLDSDEALNSVALDSKLFGEGITLLNDKLYQLTWKSRRGFIYDAQSLEPKGEFEVAGEGWGLTNNGKQLILSDGSELISFIDPENFEISRQIRVTVQGQPVRNLNELEWVNGMIYANIWQTDWIIMIDPQSGEVKGRLSLQGLLPDKLRTRSTNVLNGIAWDAEQERLFVTGKYWPRLYQIEIFPVSF